jgi:hypothetical protein
MILLTKSVNKIHQKINVECADFTKSLGTFFEIQTSAQNLN